MKYFWRDAVHGQLKTSPDKLTLLARRMSSFNVRGLGISAIAGSTLVKYAGSLTGRDFRVIAQAAPFALRGIISLPSYNAWLALGKLVPLLWQPSTSDKSTYFVSPELISGSNQQH